MGAKLRVIVVGVSIITCLVLVSWVAPGPVRSVVHESSKKFPILEDKWVLAYASDFSEKQLKPEWIVTAGNGIVAEGWMVLRVAKGHGQIILKEPCFLSPSLRMEFDAYVADYAKLNDMSPFIHSNQKGCEGSYLFQFGAKKNTINRLRRVGKIVEGTVNDKLLLEHRHLYHIVAENDRGHIRFEVDGITIFEWDDVNFLWGPEYCHIGFYTWESEIHIDNIKIYHKVPMH